MRKSKARQRLDGEGRFRVDMSSEDRALLAEDRLYSAGSLDERESRVSERGGVCLVLEVLTETRSRGSALEKINVPPNMAQSC